MTIHSQPLDFPHKQIRARVIAEFVRQAGYRGVVVFTCGNAAKTLRNEGLEVTEIGPRGDLKTEKWWTMAEIHRAWPDLFDATSGHLAVPLMGDIAKAYRAHLGDLSVGRYSVPAGSGETVTCLRIAYPLMTFDPTYDNSKPETTRHEDAPLNAIVDAESLPENEVEKLRHAHLMVHYGSLVTSVPQPPDVTRSRARRRGYAFLCAAALAGALLTFILTHCG